MRGMCVMGLLLCLCSYADAYLTGGPRVWESLAHSDEVWRGEVTATSAGEAGTVSLWNRTVPVHWFTATMRVDRVIKGNLSGATGTYAFPYVHEDDTPLNFDPAHKYLIVFLSSVDGHLTVTSPVGPPVTVPRTPSQLLGEANTPETRLAQELLRATEGTPREQEGTMDDPLGILGEVGRYPAGVQVVPFVTPFLMKWGESSPDGLRRGETLRALVTFGYAPSYTTWGTFLREQATDEPTQRGQQSAVQAIAGLSKEALRAFAKAYQQQSGATLLSVLVPLLHHPREAVRQVVACALRHCDAVHAIAPLIGTLDDESKQVRSTVVVSLCALTRQQDHAWGTSLDVLETPEQLAVAVALWKDWWEKTGKKWYGGTDAATSGAIPSAAHLGDHQ